MFKNLQTFGKVITHSDNSIKKLKQQLIPEYYVVNLFYQPISHK